MDWMGWMDGSYKRCYSYLSTHAVPIKAVTLCGWARLTGGLIWAVVTLQLRTSPDDDSRSPCIYCHNYFPKVYTALSPQYLYMFWSILKYCIKYHYQILYQMLSIGALFPQNHQLEMADFPPNILMPSPLSADLPNWVFRSLKTSLFPPLFVGSLFQSSMFKSLSRVWEPAPEGETCFSRETFCIFAIRQFAKQRLAEKCCQRWYLVQTLIIRFSCRFSPEYVWRGKLNWIGGRAKTFWS